MYEYVNMTMAGLGATAAQIATAAQKKAAAKAAATARQTAAKVAAANRQAAAKAKKLVKVAGQVKATSNPAAAAQLNSSVTGAQTALKNATAMATAALKSKKPADLKAALAYTTAAGQHIQEVMSKPASPTSTPAVAATTKLRGLGYFGSCVQNADGSVSDNGDGMLCAQTSAPVYSTGLAPAPALALPSLQLPQIQLPTAVNNRVRSCQNGSNSAFCIVYNMSIDEQSQFQYVFQLLQQMYAQLLQIVQQLMAQLQSTQQQPVVAAGYNPYDPNANPYAQTPYGPSQYGDPNAQFNAYGQQQNPYGMQSPYGQQPMQPQMPQYGGQYQSPASPAIAPQTNTATAVPTGYDQGGAASAIAPAAPPPQVVSTPAFSQSGPPTVTGPGVPPTILISSDSLPAGVDHQSVFHDHDDAGGIVPQSQDMTPPDVSQFDPMGGDPNQDSMAPQQDQGLYSGSGASYGDGSGQPQLYPPMPGGVIDTY